MTNREAIAAEIEPYSLSEDGLEKLFIDSAAHFGIYEDADVDDDYEPAYMRTVALCAMRCLARMRVLANEKVDVISNTYNVDGINKAIASIAASAGLSPALVDAENDKDSLTAVQIW